MLLEAQRIEQRTKYDIEMLSEIGFCKGIENYSRILAGRPAGSMPYTPVSYTHLDVYKRQQPLLRFLAKHHGKLCNKPYNNRYDTSQRQPRIEAEHNDHHDNQ